MDIRKVKKLIELLEESGIAEIEISEGEESVRISRNPAAAPAAHPVAYAPPPAPLAAAQGAVAASAPAPAATAALETSGHKVLAPMVGTFYRSSSPESEPFANNDSA